MSMWEKLIEKIELQSVLVLFTTLLFGVLLLYKDNSTDSPAGILGSVSIIIGLLYTFGSFFSNQIRESYKDVILEYKSTINTLRSSNKEVLKSYQDFQSTTLQSDSSKNLGQYKTTTVIRNETMSQ